MRWYRQGGRGPKRDLGTHYREAHCLVGAPGSMGVARNTCGSHARLKAESDKSWASEVPDVLLSCAGPWNQQVRVWQGFLPGKEQAWMALPVGLSLSFASLMNKTPFF